MNKEQTTLKPSLFTVKPWGSVFKKSEAETVATNIMVILKRTGDIFRELTYEEYKEERLKDGEFTSGEENYFNKVIEYCMSADKAALFSDTWKEIYNKAEHPTAPTVQKEDSISEDNSIIENALRVLIEKLKADNKLLREALEYVVNIPEIHTSAYLKNIIEYRINPALEQTKL